MERKEGNIFERSGTGGGGNGLIAGWNERQRK